MDLFWLNVVSAFAAFLLMALVTIGFAPHLRLGGTDANGMMGRFVALVSSLVSVRLLWWSLLRPLLGETGHMPEVSYSLSTNMVNTGFNLWACAAALAALAALHRSLPVGDRDQYNWFNAPFYPRRFTIYWRS